MPDEIELSPKTVTSRLRDWIGDLVTYVEVSAAKVFSFGVASVATRTATELNVKSGQALNDGLSKAIKLHREAKELVSEEDRDEMDLFEVFKGAAMAQTKLMSEAIAQGVSPQPIDRAALERPTKALLTSQTESLNGEPREVNEAKQGPQQQPGQAVAKRKPGRPRKDDSQNDVTRVVSEEASQAGQPPEQTPKRKRGRPRKEV